MHFPRNRNSSLELRHRSSRRVRRYAIYVGRARHRGKIWQKNMIKRQWRDAETSRGTRRIDEQRLSLSRHEKPVVSASGKEGESSSYLRSIESIEFRHEEARGKPSHPRLQSSTSSEAIERLEARRTCHPREVAHERDTKGRTRNDISIERATIDHTLGVSRLSRTRRAAVSLFVIEPGRRSREFGGSNTNDQVYVSIFKNTRSSTSPTACFRQWIGVWRGIVCDEFVSGHCWRRG